MLSYDLELPGEKEGATTPWGFPNEEISMDGENILNQIRSPEYISLKNASQEDFKQAKMRKKRTKAPCTICVSDSNSKCLAKDETLKSEPTLPIFLEHVSKAAHLPNNLNILTNDLHYIKCGLQFEILKKLGSPLYPTSVCVKEWIRRLCRRLHYNIEHMSFRLVHIIGKKGETMHSGRWVIWSFLHIFFEYVSFPSKASARLGI